MYQREGSRYEITFRNIVNNLANQSMYVQDICNLFFVRKWWSLKIVLNGYKYGCGSSDFKVHASKYQKYAVCSRMRKLISNCTLVGKILSNQKVRVK